MPLNPPCARHRYRHLAAAGVFALLVWWHFLPVFPTITTQVPSGGTFDIYNFVAAPLTVARALIRTPWCFWRGDRPYPEPYATTLHQVDIPYAFTFSAFYALFANAMLAFNLCAFLLFFMNGFALYLLIERWRGAWLAGLLAGALCAFFPHAFFCMELDIEVTYVTSLSLLLWLVYLQRGGWAWLFGFFAVVALKATTPDYQGIFLALVLALAVPLGFYAYPERWRGERGRFMLAGVMFALLLLPFYVPYYNVLMRYPGHGWLGVMFVDCTHLTRAELAQVFTNFIQNIGQLRCRFSPDPRILLWPGAVFLVSAALAVVWNAVVPLVRGRRAALRWALLLAAVFAGLLTFTSQVPLGTYGTLARLYVDPPILAVVRAPRAFIFSLVMCLSMLIGLMAGDVLGWARTRHWWAWPARLGVMALLVLATLEDTVQLRPSTSYSQIVRPQGVYAWLRQQRYPSPFIEFPYAVDFNLNVQGALAALADQPSAQGRSRYVHPLLYFLQDCSSLPPAEKAALISVAPYRYLVQHGADAAFRAAVEAASDLREVTNFSDSAVFENPAPGKVFPLDLVVTQLCAQSLPNIIYTLHLGFICTNGWTFVPEAARAVQTEIALLDAARKQLVRLRTREELPLVINGRDFTMNVQVQYDLAAGRVRAQLLRPGRWRIAKAPVAQCRAPKNLFAARWLEVTVTRPGAQQTAHSVTPVVPLSPRWPYYFGTPVAYQYQAGGFDSAEQDATRTWQRSIARVSAVLLPRPLRECAELVISAKSAVPFVKEPVCAHVTLNGHALGTLTAGIDWTEFALPVARDFWQDENRIVFTYPQTWMPCLQYQGNDAQRRALAFAWLAVRATRAPTPPVQPTASAPASTAQTNVLKNGDFSQVFAAWTPRRATDVTNELGIVADERFGHAVRIANPRAVMPGLQQLVALRSGAVYRVAAWARSQGANPAAIFGGRVALWHPPQLERALIWLTENPDWQLRSLTFTNTVTGVATLYMHMGYGSVASTGDFTALQLMELSP